MKDEVYMVKGKKKVLVNRLAVPAFEKAGYSKEEKKDKPTKA